MDRRHYLALSGSVAFAGCSGDPSGIISGNSSDSNTPDSSSTENPMASSQSPIETTIDGTGSSLHQITVENDGLTFFQIDTTEIISVSLINSEADSSLTLGVGFPSAFTKTPVNTQSSEYALEIEAESDINWSITVEDHPIYSEDTVNSIEFPLEFAGEGTNVFGPFLLNGFYQPRIRTNVDTSISFASQQGETLHSLSADIIANDDYADSFVNLDPISVREICWVVCDLNPNYTTVDSIDDISYEIQITEPDNN